MLILCLLTTVIIGTENDKMHISFFSFSILQSSTKFTKLSVNMKGFLGKVLLWATTFFPQNISVYPHQQSEFSHKISIDQIYNWQLEILHIMVSYILIRGVKCAYIKDN